LIKTPGDKYVEGGINLDFKIICNSSPKSYGWAGLFFTGCVFTGNLK
jgi:hypothetical protein